MTLQLSVSINCNVLIVSVMFPICVNFSQRIYSRKGERLIAVTKLRNEIYVLFEGRIIRVYDNLNYFSCLKEIEIHGKEINGHLFDIGSIEKDNCLYASEAKDKGGRVLLL